MTKSMRCWVSPWTSWCCASYDQQAQCWPKGLWHFEVWVKACRDHLQNQSSSSEGLKYRPLWSDFRYQKSNCIKSLLELWQQTCKIDGNNMLRVSVFSVSFHTKLYLIHRSAFVIFSLSFAYKSFSSCRFQLHQIFAFSSLCMCSGNISVFLGSQSMPVPSVLLGFCTESLWLQLCHSCLIYYT